MSRFSEPQHPVFHQLNASIGFDWRLGPYDVDLSRAHARCSPRRGSSPHEDRDELLAALDTVEHELEEGTFPFLPDDEDVHMAIERRITELAGPVGGKLHTARSRNDQVATDMALFTRAHAQAAGAGDRATLMRGAARRRRAPPRLARCPATRTSSAPSRSTSATTCSRTSGCSRATSSASPPSRRRPAELPLGAGALAGVNFDTDRRRVARELGFAGVAENSIDAVSNRDFVLDYLAAAATCATHLIAPRRRDRAVVEQRVRLRRGLRRVGVGLVDHAAEEEPRRGRAAAREGAADRRPLRRAAGRACTRSR